MARNEETITKDREDQDEDRNRRDLLALLLLLLIAFACLFITAQFAVRQDRFWQVSAGMLSELDLDLDRPPVESNIEPIRPEVMTPPSWDPGDLLTPVGTSVIVPTAMIVPLPTVTATPQEIVVVPTSTPSAVPTSRPPTRTRTPSPTAVPSSTPTPPPMPTSTPLPTPSSTPVPTPVPPTPSDTPGPQPPTDTPPPSTPSDTPPPSDTATPTATPTPTDTPTPTPTPLPPPSVLSITPDRGLRESEIAVVITGSNFFGVPTARLGSDVFINVTAATADTITGSVPAGIIPGVYGLTVINPDSQSGTLSPAYIALNPASPSTTLERGYLALFGPGASGAEGDDDHVQVIFFEVPDGTSGDLYFRIYDADTGGGGVLDIDEQAGAWNTTIAYTLRGGAGAYTGPGARSSHPNPAGIGSGTLLAQQTIGADPAYHDNWALVFGPHTAGQGERVGSSRLFKLVVQGTAGDDGNDYNAVLSTAAGENIAPVGSRVFAYSWTFPLISTFPQQPPLYPYVGASISNLEQHNWDGDYAGGAMRLHTPMRELFVPGDGISGDGDEAWSGHTTQAGENATWTALMEFSFPTMWNDVTFWAVGDGVDVAIFTHPTMDPPP